MLLRAVPSGKNKVSPGRYRWWVQVSPLAHTTLAQPPDAFFCHVTRWSPVFVKNSLSAMFSFVCQPRKLASAQECTSLRECTVWCACTWFAATGVCELRELSRDADEHARLASLSRVRSELHRCVGRERRAAAASSGGGGGGGGGSAPDGVAIVEAMTANMFRSASGGGGRRGGGGRKVAASGSSHRDSSASGAAAAVSGSSGGSRGGGGSGGGERWRRRRWRMGGAAQSVDALSDAGRRAARTRGRTKQRVVAAAAATAARATASGGAVADVRQRSEYDVREPPGAVGRRAVDARLCWPRLVEPAATRVCRVGRIDQEERHAPFDIAPPVAGAANGCGAAFHRPPPAAAWFARRWRRCRPAGVAAAPRGISAAPASRVTVAEPRLRRRNDNDDDLGV